MSLERSTVITLAITILLATHTAAYVVGERISNERIKHLESIVSEYKESKNLNHPETIKSLQEASKSLSLSLNERKRKVEIENTLKDNLIAIKLLKSTLEKKTDDAAKEKLEFSKSKSKLDEKINDLNSQLSKYNIVNQEFKLKEKSTKELVKNQVILGLDSTYSFGVQVRLNNSESTMKISDNVNVKVGDDVCSLYLLSFNSYEASFRFSCPS